MTAKIAGFVTRAQAGLRPPKSVSKNITPSSGGVALHYGGPAQKLGDHAQCVQRWKQWQTFHMDSRGWADIAYTGGVCNHGYAFAGRGAGVRTAANGTNAGNQSFYAITWIGGEGETPTQEAKDAFEWWVLELRKSGAGKQVRPHRYFKATGCPGDFLVTFAATLHNKDISAAPAGDRVLGLGDKGEDVKQVQTLLGKHGFKVVVDGDFGPNTEAAVKNFQSAKKLTVDGIVGPNTWKALRAVQPAPAPAPQPAPQPAPTNHPAYVFADGRDGVLVQFKGDNHVYEIVGSELVHVTAEAWKARGLNSTLVKIVEPTHPLNNLPKKDYY